MKIRINLLNQNCEYRQILRGGVIRTHRNACFAIFALLLTFGVGNAWADMYLIGNMNNWDADNWSDTYKFVDNKLEVTLPANTEYQFKIRDGYDDRYCVTTISNTALNYELDKTGSDSHITLQTGEAGTYIFQYGYYDDKHHISVYFPQARLKKQKYIYFDARRLTGSNSDYWQRGDFTARFYFKYYDSGVDNENLDCTHANALEDWVYYALVPNHDYIGQIQMNRLQVGTEELCVANIAYAKDRPSSLENCLQEESGKENYCNSWTPQWTTYCPPMSSVTLADNGTTTWGGNGSSATPYLVPTGGDINVHVTASASALDDANMTQYFLFKKAGSAVGTGSASTEKTISAASTTGTKEAVIVEAYNYYNSTEGTHLASSAIYYEARTPYTISYSKGSPSDEISGSRDSDTKLKDVAFTLPGAIFTRTGYTQTGWATSDGGSKGYELSVSYTVNEDLPLFPFWTAKNYTINLEGMEADTEDPIQVNVTYDGVLSQVTPHTKTNYTFDGYWTSDDLGATLDYQLIDANGNWIKDVAGYTSNDGEGHPTWVHDYAISLYAKWTETPRTITLNVSPDGAGTLSPAGPVTAYIVTPSATITATPNPGWVFKEWQYGTNVGPYAETGTDNTVQVTASVNGTLTAVFEPRYYLVGGEITGEGDGGSGTSSGMPGWDSYTKPFNVITSSPILATCSLTLGTNKNFYIMVRDKTDGLSYGKSGGISLGDDASVKFENQDNKVLFYSNGGTNYTFKITAVDVNGRPTVSVERPHQMHFAHKRVDIDGDDHNDDLGGTLTATINGESAAHEQWFDYGSDVGWTATAETGYSLTWYTDNAYSNAMNPQPGASWSDPDITHDENIFAKFEEKATTVTLSNDGHGKVQINSTDKTSTTCGVTTHRDLTAVPNDGYKFASWTKVSGDDITLSSTSTNPTTLSGLGAGAASGQEVRANFDYRWALKAESVGWGSAEFIIGNISVVGGKTIGYVDISLAANTNYQFTMKDLLTNDIYKNNNTAVQYMTYTNNTDWGFDKTYTYNCGITTAGRGTYRFSWNVTDKTMTVTYQPSYQVNFGASVGGSVTSVVDDDGNSVPNGGYVRSGGSVTYTAAAANEYYTFAGWCTDDTYATKFTDDNPWTNSAISANSNAYAKFKSTNFVIYRTGDKDDDPRAALDDVESYEGGTISETIEYRMKVHELDYWYSLCLPFTVSAVRVWDDEDKAYYDLEPYYRTGVGGTLNGGHYIIRTPASATDFPIANFDDWRDPTSATGFLPGKNTPYIIQWHSSYFSGKYISFFGDTGQNIPASMTVGTAPESDDVVNIYGNDAMVRGSVAGAYMLEGDYGGGAWLRQQDPSAYSTVLPFECYIRASSAVTSKYRVIRRDMHTEDTTTGWDDVSNAVTSATITVYTLTGVLVAQFNNCSISEAALRLSNLQHENIYILRTDNECVKLINGLPANQYSEESMMGGK